MKRIFTFSLVLPLLFSLETMAGGQPTESTKDKRGKVWIFRDGAGNPLSFATGIVYVRMVGLNKRQRATSFVLDEQGKCRWFYTSDKRATYYIELSHPDYGFFKFRAPMHYKVKPWDAYEEYEYFIPCVPEDTEAYQRSIRGFIIDDANNPIEGATVECNFLYTSDRHLVRARGRPGVMGCLRKVNTDENGWFCMYLPTDKYDKGRLIPKNASYSVRIEAPRGFGLVPFVGEVINSAEQIIKMDEYGYFHTFIFEDEKGIVTDPDKLNKTHIEISSPEKGEVDYDYVELKNGGYFPLGRYRAWTNYGVKYKPIEVTKDSPEQLVFSLPASITYTGRVVHGITGAPMEGAFVIALTGYPIAGYGGNNLSHITDEQWDMLYILEESFFIEDKVLTEMRIPGGFAKNPGRESDEDEYLKIFEPLANIFHFEKGARTDKNGKFRISFLPGEVFNSFVAFAKDYLAVERLKYGLEANPNRVAEVPTMPLYPAATVKARILIKRKDPWVRAFWVIDTDNLPLWAKEPVEEESDEIGIWSDETYVKDLNSFFSKVSTEVDLNDNTSWMGGVFEDTEDDPNMFTSFYEICEGTFWHFRWNRSLIGNKTHFFQVPANLQLNFMFCAERNLDSKWIAFTFPQTINLRQGEMLDLGVGEIQLAPQVFVKVVDSNGIPVRGIPVQHWLKGYGVLLTKSTDENGIVSFYGRCNQEAKFIVCSEGAGPKLKEELPYEIRSEEDMNSEFILSVPDELIDTFFK
jgi:hypothetical protein